MDVEASIVVLALFGGLTLLGLVGTIGGFLHYRRERLLTHQERMKALELGHDLPDDPVTARIKATFGASSKGGDGNGSLARKCYSTALWVAFWGFIAASQGGWGHAGISVAIAGSVGAIGVTAIICGTILAVRERSGSEPVTVAKPLFESDAFDVVSHRG
jgi:hypothetical protein